jgi:hypothetical protein
VVSSRGVGIVRLKPDLLEDDAYDVVSSRGSLRADLLKPGVAGKPATYSSATVAITMHEINALWIPILGIMVPIVLVPTIMILKHRTLQKEWQHKERMQAIELGVPAASAHLGGSIAPEGEEVAVMGIVWGCALMIGAIAMVSSLFLAHMHTRVRKDAESSLHVGRNGKPVFDPDAFDVVSNRG